MRTETVKGKPNYPGLAELAREHLKDRWNYTGITDAPHINPVTQQACSGTLVIYFNSWQDALNSRSMLVSGGVGATCISCGGGVFVDENKQIVRFQ